MRTWTLEPEAGQTALHFAAVGSHLDMIRLLVKKGADVNARDANGTSPLDHAVWRGYLDATAVLLANGARLNEIQTKTGATPISEAAYRGQTRIGRYLLQFGPNLKLAYTPLENAIRKGNTDSVTLLEAQATEQETPEFLGKMMSAAVQKDESVIVESLFRRGADANDPLPSGATPLDAAASAGALKVVRALLNHGADPNRADRNGISPLEDASFRRFDAIAEILLDHGALVNQVNSGSGTTALYAAASFGKDDVVRLLLQRGADVNLCGNVRKTAYAAALENGYSEIAAQIHRRAVQEIANCSRYPSSGLPMPPRTVNNY